MKANHESFTPYDPADHLGGIEDVAAYLEAAIDEGGDDAAVITHALGGAVPFRNIRELARRTGMSHECLYKALSADSNLSLARLVAIRLPYVHAR